MPPVVYARIPRSLARLRITALQNHLECGLAGRVTEDVVGVHDVVESESVRNQRAGVQRSGLQQLEQQRRGHRVDESRRDGDVAVPQLFEVQLRRRAVDPDVGDSAADRYERLTR